MLLGHLIAYLRAALPQLRARSSTLGREIGAGRGVPQHPYDAHRPAPEVRHRRSRRPARSPVSAEPADLARRERDQARRRAVGATAARSRSTAAQAGDCDRRHRHRYGARARSGQPHRRSGRRTDEHPRAACRAVRCRGTLHARAGSTARHARDAVGAARSTGRDGLESAARCLPRSLPRTSRCCARNSRRALPRRGRSSRWSPKPRTANRRWHWPTSCRPDVAFLDIRMPLVSGIEVARALAGRCHVVFVTAYDEYAVAAFDEGAVDYLLKPVTAERIAKVDAARQGAACDTAARSRGAADSAGGARGRVGAAEMDSCIARQRHADDRRCRRRLLPGRGQVHEGRHA